MRFGSQKIKIISLVLVFGFIYAVNACAHSNGLHGQFYIINGAPSVPVPSDQSDDFGNITIGNFKINKKTSSNGLCTFLTDDLKPTTSETASPGKTKTITFDTIAGATQCDADIKYGVKSSKIITPITITWEKDDVSGVTTITSITTTTTTTGSLDDEKLKAWNDELIPHNAVMTVDPLTKENDTLKYIDTRIAGAITLINNAPTITDKADKSNDISFKMPVPSTPNDCTWVNEDGSVLSQATVSPADQTKRVLFKSFKTGCFMDIVVGDTKPSTITHVTVNYNATVDSSPAYLTVKIGTDISLFNTWNNKFAVKNGSMMKLNFSTKGDGVVNFQQTDLPFPLLEHPSYHKERVTNSLDSLAYDLLSKDLPNKDGKLDIDKSIFHDYKTNSNNKTSRDIALDMLIAASMMKEHSQDSTNQTTWSQYFSLLYKGLKQITWEEGGIRISGGSPNPWSKSNVWKCGVTVDSNHTIDPCYIPYHDKNSIPSKIDEYSLYYDTNKTPNDVITQQYFAAAFQIAGEALVLKHSLLPTPSPAEITFYSNISQKIKDAILKNNRSGNYLTTTQGRVRFYLAIKPEDAYVPSTPRELGTDYRWPTYSEAILPLMYMFSQSSTAKSNWKTIINKTTVKEQDVQKAQVPRILGAGQQISQDTDRYNYGKSLGDEAVFDTNYAFKYQENGGHAFNLSFGTERDNADYFPMSLGAYLLVNPTVADTALSGTILKTEMRAIDGLTFAATENQYVKITCSQIFTDGKLGKWACDPPSSNKLTPLDMSSYLLAQLGLAAHFGQQKDDDDNRDQITSLTSSKTSSFRSTIAAYLNDPSTTNISSIILTGLYIDGAFSSTSDNPLINAHLDKDKSENIHIHYYFTLDPTYSSTLGAQVRSGAQTSYTGVKK